MIIDTRAIGFQLTDAIARHVEMRLESALGPFARSILRATVRLDDVNASRGGIDKRCCIVVAMRRQATQIAEAINQNLYAAIDEAAVRIRRSVARASKIHVSLERRDPQRPGVLVRI